MFQMFMDLVLSQRMLYIILLGRFIPALIQLMNLTSDKLHLFDVKCFVDFAEASFA